MLMILVSIKVAAEPKMEASHELKLHELANALCDIVSGDGSVLVERSYNKIKAHMMKYGGYNAPPSKKRMIEFLNQHNNDIICESTKKHYMHQAIEAGKGHQLFKMLFKKKLKAGRKGNPNINVNAVCKCGSNGEWQTPLDFIQGYKEQFAPESDNYMVADILKKTLRKRFNAKYFHELPQAVQQ